MIFPGNSDRVGVVLSVGGEGRAGGDAGVRDADCVAERFVACESW